MANHDLEKNGQGANASTKGLAELHFPGSPHLSIKYFMSSNVTISERAITRGKQHDISILSIEDQLAEPSNESCAVPSSQPPRPQHIITH